MQRLRRLPLLALLGVLVTAAFGMGPAAAVAAYPVLKDSSGVTLKPGQTVNGTSTDSQLESAVVGGVHACDEIKFSSKVVSNSSKGTSLGEVTFPTFKCYAWFAEKLTYTFEFKGIHSPSYTFLANGAVQYSIGPGEMKISGIGSAQCTIDPAASSGGAIWLGESPPDPARLDYSTLFKFTNGCSGYNTRVFGIFNLSMNNGQPVNIVLIP